MPPNSKCNFVVYQVVLFVSNAVEIHFPDCSSLKNKNLENKKDELILLYLKIKIDGIN